MKKEETRVVAYFDILGYKSLVKEILDGDKEDGLKMFAKDLEDAQKKAIDRFEGFGPMVYKRVFSDCICLSASVKGECESIVLNKIAVSIVVTSN